MASCCETSMRLSTLKTTAVSVIDIVYQNLKIIKKLRLFHKGHRHPNTIQFHRFSLLISMIPTLLIRPIKSRRNAKLKEEKPKHRSWQAPRLPTC